MFLNICPQDQVIKLIVIKIPFDKALKKFAKAKYLNIKYFTF